VEYLLRLKAQKQAAKAKNRLADRIHCNSAVHIKDYTKAKTFCNTFFLLIYNKDKNKQD